MNQSPERDLQSRRSFEEILRAHRAKIARVARRLVQGMGGRLVHDEIVSAGVVALWQSWLCYDPARSPDFWQFAFSRVRGAMVDEMRFMDHLSRDARQNVKRENTDRLSWALLYPCDLDDARNVSDCGDAEEHGRMLEMVRRAAETLFGAERRVVCEHFFEGRKVDDVARELGVSGSRVSQLVRSAVARMRDVVAGDGYEVGEDAVRKRGSRVAPNMLAFQGRRQSVRAWAAERKMIYQTLTSRLKRGWSVEKSLTEPARPLARSRDHSAFSSPTKETSIAGRAGRKTP